MPGTEQKIEATLKKIPWWGYALGGGAVLGGVYYIRKHGNPSVPASSASPNAVTGAQPAYATPDGLNMADLAGMPFDYYDYSAAMNGTSTSTPTATNNPPPVTTPPVTTPPDTTPPPIPTPSPAPSPSPSPAPTPAPALQPWYAGSLDAQGRTTSDPGSTLNDIARWYGVPWDAIAYNQNNKNLYPNFLPDAFAKKGNNVLPTGTKVYIPTSLIPSTQPMGTGHGGGDVGWLWPEWTHMSGFPAEHMSTQAEEDMVG